MRDDHCMLQVFYQQDCPTARHMKEMVQMLREREPHYTVPDGMFL